MIWFMLSLAFVGMLVAAFGRAGKIPSGFELTAISFVLAAAAVVFTYVLYAYGGVPK